MSISTSAVLGILLFCMSDITVNAQGTCQDTNAFCYLYKTYGLCETYKAAMTLTCPVTCDLCPAQAVNWSEWGDWEDCPAACGTTGTQLRRRTCQNGNTCTGSATESRSCAGPTCPPVVEWSEWGDWGDCQASCGTTGTQERTRTCQNGNTCSGSNTDTQSCAGPACAPEWSEWGNWGACNAACGTTGNRKRTRTCLNGNTCSGFNTMRKSCVGPTCSPVVSWSEWSNWGNCQAACGTTGTQERTRTCQNGNTCPGSNRGSRSCNGPTCPPVVAWSTWGSWSTCNAACDATGTQERTRQCQNGNSCPGSNSESQSCTGPTCPPGQVWDAWSDCSQSCGIGYQTRTRSCAVGCTEYGGQQCPQVADCTCTEDLCGSSGSCFDVLNVCGQIKANGVCTLPGYVAYLTANCAKSCGYCTDCVCEAAWSEWNSWTACSESCGVGTRWRYRDCNKVAGCGDEYFEIGTCNNGVCPVWTDWSVWTSCDCATMKRSRSRECSIANACTGESLMTEDCVPVGCPAWSNWGPWATCDATCGDGKQLRIRTCINGPGCVGKKRNRKDCNLKPCPGWSTWGSWGSCDTTCGQGEKRRTRTCSNGPCSGASLDTMTCTAGDCPSWTAWTQWTGCDETCGGGEQTRTRTCNNGPCQGSSSQTKSCNTQVCPVTAWSPWGQWSSCDKNCGGGERRRTRTCQNGSVCPGSMEDVDDCNSQACPSWTAWTQWTNCDQSCGGGEQTRTRTCNNGPCQGSSSQTKSCNTQVCPVWSPWGQWSSCDKNCGGGERRRTRTCQNGSGCSGSMEDVDDCNSQTCPSWSSWTQWTNCDKSCGSGEQTRTRTCSNGPCQGSSSGKKTCNTNVCPDWTPWGTWSGCSKTCGGGKRSQMRTCQNGPGCVGSNKTEENCNEDPCPSWTKWTNWGTCDKTCGDGEQTRTRICNNGPCTSGSSSDTQTCNLGDCQASWSSWGQWSSCAVTCGRGSQTRTRTCTGSGSCEGDSSEVKTCVHATVCPCTCTGCPNNPTYDTYCRDPTVKVYCTQGNFIAWFHENCQNTCGTCQCTCGTWSDWDNWSDCAPSCGNGQRSRTRTCPSGKKCEGVTVEGEACTNPVACQAEWNEWGGWGACVGSCGSAGTRTRTRVCSNANLCSGSSTEQGSCTGSCESNPWGPCSRTCGQGTRSRPKCVGCALEYDDCEIIKCPTLNCAANHFRRYSVNNHTCCSGNIGSCGRSRTQGRIVNGREAKAEQWPWMVYMIFNNNLCGGMVISNTWVLSAAHCFSGVQASAITATFGALLFQKSSPHQQTRSVSQVIIHPQYSFPKHDVALLRLSSAVNYGAYVQPICLPQGERALVGNMCVAAGWGKLAKGSALPKTLMEVDLRILEHVICSNAYQTKANFDENSHICAGAVRGGVDTCNGDSGGPLMCQRCANCGWFVAGITSFGDPNCGGAKTPGMYARVRSYESWIRTYTGIAAGATHTACR